MERQYFSSVRPMAEKYIWPTRIHAGVIVRGDSPLDESVATVLAFAANPPASYEAVQPQTATHGATSEVRR